MGCGASMKEPPNNWMNLTKPAQATELRRLSRSYTPRAASTGISSEAREGRI
jgi:hypothetical protein